MEIKVNNSALKLIDGDITEMDSDAIVNAANEKLVLGGGIAGAIRKKGGAEIQQHCSKIGRIHIGEAVITTAGNLKAKYVIHAVGPQMGEGNEDEKLKNATLNSLRLAELHNLESIALPAISTGIFGFPIKRCAEITLRTTINYLKNNSSLKEVVFCLFGSESYNVFETQLKEETQK